MIFGDARVASDGRSVDARAPIAQSRLQVRSHRFGPDNLRQREFVSGEGNSFGAPHVPRHSATLICDTNRPARYAAMASASRRASSASSGSKIDLVLGSAIKPPQLQTRQCNTIRDGMKESKTPWPTGASEVVPRRPYPASGRDAVPGWPCPPRWRQPPGITWRRIGGLRSTSGL